MQENLKRSNLLQTRLRDKTLVCKVPQQDTFDRTQFVRQKLEYTEDKLNMSDIEYTEVNVNRKLSPRDDTKIIRDVRLPQRPKAELKNAPRPQISYTFTK